jgi:hypothetical protein
VKRNKNARKALINKVKNFSFLIKSLISSLAASPEGPVTMMRSGDMVDRCSCFAGKKAHPSYMPRMTTYGSSIRTMRVSAIKIQSTCDEQGSMDITTARGECPHGNGQLRDSWNQKWALCLIMDTENPHTRVAGRRLILPMDVYLSIYHRQQSLRDAYCLRSLMICSMRAREPR